MNFLNSEISACYVMYCSSLYAVLPACRLGCLDRVLRSAARLIGGISKFGMSLNTCLMFYIGSLLSSGFHIGLFPWSGAAYLVLLLFTFVSSVRTTVLHSAMSSRSLRSSQQGLLLVPFARTFAKQSRAFSVVGPSIWNGLPSQLRIFPRALSPAFFSQLKTALFSHAGGGSASE